MTHFGKTCLNVRISFFLIYLQKLSVTTYLSHGASFNATYIRSGFDDIPTQRVLILRMKFRENRKINNMRITHALFRVNGVSIDFLEMDYKRRLSLSSSPEAGLLNASKLRTMVKL